MYRLYCTDCTDFHLNFSFRRAWQKFFACGAHAIFTDYYRTLVLLPTSRTSVAPSNVPTPHFYRHLGLRYNGERAAISNLPTLYSTDCTDFHLNFSFRRARQKIFACGAHALYITLYIFFLFSAHESAKFVMENNPSKNSK